MSSIGERLREQRLRMGLSIEQVADSTRISARYLEAIESGDLDRIPGKFFARSFLKQYASALGVDEREISAELDKLTEPEPLPTAEALDQAATRKRIEMEPIGEDRPMMTQRTWASIGVFVLMVLVCSLIYVFWQKTTEQAPAEPHQQAQTPAPRQPAPQAQQPPAPTASQPETAQQQTPPAPSTEAPAQAPPAAENQASNPAPAGAAASPPAEGSAPVRLQVTSSEPAWVRVTVDGKIVMQNTLAPGVTKTFDGTGNIRIRTGNAGALEINYNGKAVGPIGPKGQIRTLEFTPDGFHPVAPPPKPAEETGQTAP